LIVLDTHALLWFERGDPKLGPKAHQIILEGLQAGEIAISALSVWEIGMLVQKRRIRLGRELTSWRQVFRDRGLIEIPASGDIADRAARLPNMHGDPADRIITATAQTLGRLVTADRHILYWSGDLDRVDATE